ncbi:dihydrofolate reductase [Kordiimonas sp.]|uniref:dihydrofolate reductase n=1 Tax=Kordiimonas sp. TaxID=1970157 RepID=UPI003A9152F9
MISMIVAMGENRLIGRDNDLPWHIPADLKFFKATTMGKPMIMGRKTFDSIGRPLPGRRTIVVTRNPDWACEGVEVASSLYDALKLAEGADEVMIVGGAQIYAQALAEADRLYVTEVALSLEGDAYFPEINDAEWGVVSRENHQAEDKNPAYSFVVYDRIF